ncbi:MAG TPA: type II secretion system F family protein [Acidimicrobiia bacterium]|nr:type II secretion system F family protein [Acidimicrobiia bacterium]
MRRWLLGLALVLAVPVSAAMAADLVIEQVDSSDYPRVIAAVTPPSQVGGADDISFTLTENGVEREVAFELVDSADLEVLLLIDTSGSMAGEPIESARQAALSFVDQMPAEVQLGLIGFGSKPEVLAPLGGDRIAALSALEALDVAGETALYDAVIVAQEQFVEDGGRHTVVLLSDGGDTVSGASLEEATARLVTSGVQLHVVELQSPESDSAALQQLGTAGRGSVVPVSDPAALAGVYGEIAAQLVHRYEVVYTSESYGTTQLDITASTAEASAAGSIHVSFPSPPATAPPVEEAEPVSPEFRPGELIEVVGLRSSWALYAGAALIYFALAIGLLFALSPSERRHSLLPSWKSSRGSARGRLLTEFADRTTRLVERNIEERGGGGRLNTLLEQAGVLLRPAEFVVFVGSVSVAAMLIGLVWGGVFGGMVLALTVAAGARVILGMLRSRRQKAFAEQLGDSLQLLAGTLRAGYGILQAIDSLSKEAERPTADEFRRVVLEARLGRDFHDSLKAMAERLESLDFKWVVDAIQINQEVGGDLSEVLDNVGETIRDRNQIRRQISALSAEGRMSAVILLILPFAVGILISFIVPGYIQELFTHGIGIAMLIFGSILMIVGGFWIKKIVKVVF